MTLRSRPLLRWLLSTKGSLTQRTARAGLWLAIGDGCARLAGFLKVVILARLLRPADFGLIGIALLVTTCLQNFTELGFGAALIQRRGDIRPYLDTAWTAQVLRSIGISVLIVLGAPLIGWAFGEPSVVAVVRVLAAEVFFRGLVNPAVVYFRKELDTRREVAWRIAGVGAGVVVGIPAAYVLRNAWALVLSLLAASLTDAVLSYWVRAYRPSLRVDWQKLRELARFGRWVLSFQVSAFVTGYLDSVAVGKILGSTALGYYQMATQIAVMPISTIGVHLHGVMFPAFSSIDDDSRRRQALFRALRVVFSVALPTSLFLMVFGSFAVNLALGPAWAGIEPIVRVLVWAGAMRAVMTVISAFFLAVGRPELNLRSTLPRAFVLAVFLYPATALYGLAGAAYAVMFAALASFVYQAILLVGVVKISFRDVATILGGALAASLPFAGSGLLLAAWSPSVPLVAALATTVCAVGVATSIRTALSSGSKVGVLSMRRES